MLCLGMEDANSRQTGKVIKPVLPVGGVNFSANQPDKYVSLYAETAVEYVVRTNHYRLLSFYKDALKNCKKSKNINERIALLENTGVSYLMQANGLGGEQYTSRHLLGGMGNMDSSILAVAAENMAIVCLAQGDYEEAIIFFTTALRINKKEKDNARMSGNLESMGMVYEIKGEYIKALEAYLKALELNTTSNNRSGTHANLLSIGNVYCRMKKIDKALQNQAKLLEVSKALGMDIRIATNLTNMAGICFDIYAKCNKIKEYDLLGPQMRWENFRMSANSLQQAIDLCRRKEYSGFLHRNFIMPLYAYSSTKEVISQARFGGSSALEEVLYGHNKMLPGLQEFYVPIVNTHTTIGNKVKVDNSSSVSNSTKMIIIVMSLFLLAGAILAVRLVRLNRIRQKRLADIAQIHSHELRAPVATILGLEQLFNYEDPEDPQNKKIIEYIMSTSRSLDDTIKKVINKTSVKER